MLIQVRFTHRMAHLINNAVTDFWCADIECYLLYFLLKKMTVSLEVGHFECYGL